MFLRNKGFSIGGDSGVKVNNSLEVLGVKEIINWVIVMCGIQEAFLEREGFESPNCHIKNYKKRHDVGGKFKKDGLREPALIGEKEFP